MMMSNYTALLRSKVLKTYEMNKQKRQVTIHIIAWCLCKVHDHDPSTKQQLHQDKKYWGKLQYHYTAAQRCNADAGEERQFTPFFLIPTGKTILEANDKMYISSSTKRYHAKLITRNLQGITWTYQSCMPLESVPDK